MKRLVDVVPYNPDWPIQYRQEAALLWGALGSVLVSTHHFGSTSVPGLSAKPVIDILGATKDITLIDPFNEKMIALGYEPRGEYGIPGRRYFFKGSEWVHFVHVHIFEQNSSEFLRHLAFRDYLRTHPQDAQAYGALKEKLAVQYHEDIEGYMDGKDAFVKEVEKKALQWWHETREKEVQR